MMMLKLSEELIKKLRSLGDNKVAQFALQLTEETEQFAQSINYIGASEDVAGQLSYLDQSRIERIAKDGDDFWNSDLRYRAKATKVLRRLFGDKISDKDYVKFGEAWGSLMKKEVADTQNIFIARGEDIRDYYHEDVSRDLGTLGSSCMRYDWCQRYFRIYEQNENIGMVVKVVDDTVLARAILWDNMYIDRVYYATEQDRADLEAFAERNGFVDIYLTDENITINVQQWDFERYPYMDTMMYLSPGQLSSSSGEWSLQNEDGERSSEKDCECCGVSTDGDDWVTTADGTILCHDCSCWSDALMEYFNRNDAVYCESESDYFLEEDCVYVDSGYNAGWYLSESEDIALVGNDYFHIDDVVEVDDCFYLEQDTVMCEVRGESILLSDSCYMEDIGGYVHQDNVIQCTSCSKTMFEPSADGTCDACVETQELVA